MLLKIYSTARRGEALASGPSLIVASDHVGPLPVHPSGKRWRYLGTISNADRLIAPSRAIIEVAIAGQGFFASGGVFGAKPAPSRKALRQWRQIEQEMHGSPRRRQIAEQAFHLPA
jgi:hypothetical protein